MNDAYELESTHFLTLMFNQINLKMRNLILLAIATVAVVSCTNETIEPKPNYIPMKVGNYWIYENYQINEDGSEINLQKIDSVIISRDTIINGNKFFMFEGTSYPDHHRWQILQIVRDSSGYLLRSDGRVIFSDNNFTDILHLGYYIVGNDTISSYTYKMVKQLEPLTLGIGTFNVLNCMLIVNSENYPGYPKEFPYFYAANIGRVLLTWGFSTSPTKYEQRLIRYNIID